MNNLITKINEFFLNFEAIASLLLRLVIGTAFIIHGYGKFPLPPEGLIDYYDIPPFIASIVAISEITSGMLLIISGFIKGQLGNIITRVVGLNITILMLSIFVVAHQDWFFTKSLFINSQIFLLVGGLYFMIKGNKI